MDNLIGELDRLGEQLKAYGIDATSYDDGDDGKVVAELLKDDGAQLLEALHEMAAKENAGVAKEKMESYIRLFEMVKARKENARLTLEKLEELAKERERARVGKEIFVPKPHPLPLLVGSFLVGVGGAVLSHIGFLIPLPTLFVPPLAGVVLVGGGILLHYRARQAMNEAGTSPEFSRGVRALVTNGPYRWTRNPMYLGSALIGIGTGLCATSLYPIISIGIWTWYVNSKVIPGEEALLTKIYGQQYRAYSEKTPRWFSFSNNSPATKD